MSSEHQDWIGALDVVSNQVAADAIRAALDNNLIEHEDYPEVGSHDFERILTAVHAVAATLEQPEEAFRPAYKLLAARATEEATP